MKPFTQPMIEMAIVIWLTGRCLVCGQQAPMPFAPEPNNGMPFPPLMEASGISSQPDESTGVKPSPEIDLDPTHKRDPFWPVAYIPKKITITPSNNGLKSENNAFRVESEKARLPDWDTARKLLDIRGVSLIGRDKQSNAPKYIAMVGGKLVEAGDTIATLYNEQMYRWKVASISASGISLVKLDVRRE